MINRLVLAILYSVLAVPVASFATVNSQSLSVSYVCTGSAGPYSFVFPISDKSALVVIQNGTTLAPTSYTASPVNNNYNNGGKVTLNSSCSTGQSLIIQRITPITQPIVYTDNMPIPMKTLERGLDKLTEIDQEMSLKTVTCPAGQFLNQFSIGGISVCQPDAGIPGPPGPPGPPGLGNSTIVCDLTVASCNGVTMPVTTELGALINACYTAIAPTSLRGGVCDGRGLLSPVSWTASINPLVSYLEVILPAAVINRGIGVQWPLGTLGSGSSAGAGAQWMRIHGSAEPKGTLTSITSNPTDTSAVFYSPQTGVSGGTTLSGRIELDHIKVGGGVAGSWLINIAVTESQIHDIEWSGGAGWGMNLADGGGCNCTNVFSNIQLPGIRLGGNTNFNQWTNITPSLTTGATWSLDISDGYLNKFDGVNLELTPKSVRLGATSHHTTINNLNLESAQGAAGGIKNYIVNIEAGSYHNYIGNGQNGDVFDANIPAQSASNWYGSSFDYPSVAMPWGGVQVHGINNLSTMKPNVNPLLVPGAQPTTTYTYSTVCNDWNGNQTLVGQSTSATNLTAGLGIISAQTVITGGAGYSTGDVVTLGTNPWTDYYGNGAARWTVTAVAGVVTALARTADGAGYLGTGTWTTTNVSGSLAGTGLTIAVNSNSNQIAQFSNFPLNGCKSFDILIGDSAHYLKKNVAPSAQLWDVRGVSQGAYVAPTRDTTADVEIWGAIRNGAYTVPGAYTKYRLGCFTATGQVGNCTVASATTTPFLGVLMDPKVDEQSVNRAKIVTQGPAIAEVKVAATQTHGDFYCPDPANAGYAINTGATPCAGRQVGVAIADEGSATTHLIFVTR